MTVDVIVRVLMLVIVVMLTLMIAGSNDVHFRGGEAAAHDLTLFKTGADIEAFGGFFKEREGYARIDERAEEHVAADAREAFQIADTHRGLILNGAVRMCA